jgi:hypothetical protein
VTVQICESNFSSSSVLFDVKNPTTDVWGFPCYKPYSYSWIATGTSATLSFFFRHDPQGWLLDDVSVSSGSIQMIQNGGFELGNLQYWNYTLSSGRCGTNPGQVFSASVRNYSYASNYFYYALCGNNGCDVISQTFSTVAGTTYNISFFLTNKQCCGATEIAGVTIT